MIILQILLTIGSFGIVGFVLYWVAVVLHAGPEVTKQQVDQDKRLN